MADLQEVRQKSFSDQRVDLDGKHYIQCKFTRCLLVFSGGPVGLEQNTLADCTWEFAGAAANTIGFLTALYHMGPPGLQLVEGTFNNIRMKQHPKRPGQ